MILEVFKLYMADPAKNQPVDLNHDLLVPILNFPILVLDLIIEVYVMKVLLMISFEQKMEIIMFSKDPIIGN